MIIMNAIYIYKISRLFENSTLAMDFYFKLCIFRRTHLNFSTIIRDLKYLIVYVSFSMLPNNSQAQGY